MIQEPEEELGTREEAQGFSVDVISGHSHVLSGVRNQVRVLLHVRTPSADSAALMARPPLRVACVLDNSGSMGGPKLAYAKRAVMKLIKHLDQRDELHFVTYNSNARVVFENGDLSDSGKDALRSEIQATHARGGTNLMEGLEQAAALLLPPIVRKEGEGEPLRRMFLFSDGCVNQGVTDRSEILRSVRGWSDAGIATTSFGIGSDFDETLMRQIAEEGKGRYAYLATAEDIPKLVSKSVHDLLDLYASDAVVEVRGNAHTIVSKVWGDGHDDVDGGDDSSDTAASPTAVPGYLVLGDLHHDNVRRILIELEVSPPGDVDPSVAFSAAHWTLTFQLNNIPMQFGGQVEFRSSETRNAIGEEAIEVRVAYAIQRSADLDLRVARLLSRGDRTRAREVKGQQIGLLQTTLAAARDGNVLSEAEVVARVLERAQRVAVHLEEMDADGDSDVVRRHCVHEMTLCRAMSDAGWGSGCDSDSNDVGNLDDLAGLSPPGSPPSSLGGTPANTPPGSPRMRNSRQRSFTPPLTRGRERMGSPLRQRRSVRQRLSLGGMMRSVRSVVRSIRRSSGA